MHRLMDCLTVQALVAWYRTQPRAVARAVRSARRRGVLQPADRAAPSDRVLRRPPARLQLQHARQEGARPAEHRRAARNAVRARHRSARDRQAAAGAARCDDAAAAGRRATSFTQFAAEADRQVLDALAHGDLERPGHPLLDRAEAVFTILEHEAMHQETLLYMWHRLPFEQKRRPPATHRASTARRRRAGVDRDSRGLRDARRRSRDRSPFGMGQRVSGAAASRSPRSRSSATTSPTRDSSSSSSRRLPRRALVDARRTGSGCSASASPIRCSGSAHDGALVLARHVRADSAAAGVAGVCQPRRGVGVRAVARRAAADRGRVPARRVRLAGRASGAHPWGERRADGRARRVRLLELGSRAGRQPSAGRSAWGVDDLVGNGWEWTSTTFAPFPGLRADAVVSGVLGRLLRRRALRHEGRVAGDGARAAAADLPQLVPAALSLCLCDIPLRPRATLQPTLDARAVRRATSRTTCTLTPRQLPSRYLYDALGSALFDAICELPWYAITRAEMRLLARARPRDLRARSDPVARWSSSGPAAARSWRRWSRPARSATPLTVHLVDVSPAALDRAAPRARRARRRRRGRRTRRRTRTGSSKRGRAARRRAARWCCSSARTSATSIRRAPTRSCAASARALATGRRAAHRRRSGEARSATCCWPTTIRSASPRPSTATCSCAINRELGGDFDIARVRATARCGTRRLAHGDAPRQPRSSSACASTRRRPRVHASTPARRSGPRAPTSIAPRTSSRCSGAPASA